MVCSEGTYFERLPKPIKDQLERLYGGVLLQKPKEAIAILQPRSLSNTPMCPKSINFLNNAYQALGDQDNAQRVLKETLERFPITCLPVSAMPTTACGRVNRKGAQDFDGNYGLSLLYPGRKLFHISEVLGFNTVMAFHALKGNPAALRCTIRGDAATRPRASTPAPGSSSGCSIHRGAINWYGVCLGKE